MEGYLGETPLKTIYGSEAALIYIGMYGSIDGAHHKDWVLDQVARILHGAPVQVSVAKWENGTENLRYRVGEPTAEYTAWVVELKAGEDGPDTYGYDEGIAP